MSSENFVHPSTYRDADGNIAPENREAWMKSMEQMSKDRFVEIEGLEVLRQKVSDCFKREGSLLFLVVSSRRREPRGQLQGRRGGVHQLYEGEALLQVIVLIVITYSFCVFVRRYGVLNSIQVMRSGTNSQETRCTQQLVNRDQNTSCSPEYMSPPSYQRTRSRFHRCPLPITTPVTPSP